MPDSLHYAENRAPAERCRACKGVGSVETPSKNLTPCTQPGCDGGFLWVDGSQPTFIGPGVGKVPVIAARERLGLPLIHPEDELQPARVRRRSVARKKPKEPETVAELLQKWRADQRAKQKRTPHNAQAAPHATIAER